MSVNGHVFDWQSKGVKVENHALSEGRSCLPPPSADT